MASNNKGRHAYLIIAHDKFDQLALLLSVLDDPRNDIFLHMDKKSAYNEVSQKNLQRTLHDSALIFVKRVDVTWGGYSQVLSEMNLFSEAGKGHYDYYHLLSGIDFPLKTQDEIHHFFQQNYGKEFVHFSEDIYQKSAEERMKYYRLWIDFSGRSENIFKKSIGTISYAITKIQKICRVNRIRKGAFQNVKSGSNWVSITDALCHHIISCKENISHAFRYTIYGDEELVQTIVWNSTFRKNLYWDKQGALELLENM